MALHLTAAITTTAMHPATVSGSESPPRMAAPAESSPTVDPAATHHVPPRRAYWLHAGIIGGVAALIAAALMLWLSRVAGVTPPAQALVDRLTAALPLRVQRDILTRFEGDAKPLTLTLLTLAQVLVGAVIAIVATHVLPSARRARLSVGAALSVGYWLVWSAVLLPLGNAGWFGSNAAGSLWRMQGVLIASAFAFGTVLAVGLWPQGAPTIASADPSRRRLLTATGRTLLLAAPALLSAGYLARAVRGLRREPPEVSPVAGNDTADPFTFERMSPLITPVSEFYVVSKNLVDPQVAAAEWTLSVEGLVARPLRLTEADILQRPTREMPATLTCISNTIGGPYISNAVWTGFPLRELLDEAGLRADTVDIELHAADDYVESIPLEEALTDDTWLVHHINAERLPDSHGFPLRLIVPGRYGIKNVKWITHVIAVGTDVQGYWQQRAWSDTAVIVTSSRIDTPHRGQRFPLGSTIRIGGIAFAGDRGITRVELSLDDGRNWQDADLEAEQSVRSWRRWRVRATPTQVGIVKLAVRATDGTGAVQTAEARDPLPEGATGYHRTWFEVVPV